MERRAYAQGVELRKTETGSPVLRGYAARFGSVYSMGWFTEEVDKNAFKSADLSDVRVLFNHDPSLLLGRTKSGTARVGVDKEGLWYEVDLPDTANGENVRAAVERGDLDQSSWGFMLRVDKDTNGDKWEKRDGKEHRILTDVELVFDASPVTFPANPDTTVAKRSLEAYEAEKPADPETEEKNDPPSDTGAADIETEIAIAILQHEMALTY